METIADHPGIAFDLFSADEIGWVGADADLQAVLLGTTTGPLPKAHERIESLLKIAAHPRLVRAIEARLGNGARIAQSAYWRSWDGTQPAIDGTDGQVALVFLGWRGKVGGTTASLGSVLLLDGADVATLTVAGRTPVGPFLIVRYAGQGGDIPALADDCLWPSAWCV